MKVIASEELTRTRRKEIIDACRRLYERMSFRDITIKDIGAETSFTRTSIYNYFQTREEIFLGLLKQEFDDWCKDLESLSSPGSPLTAQAFAERLSDSLERRSTMLKLLSMNLYDMEANSRLEELTSFKLSYGESMKLLRSGLKSLSPGISPEAEEGFIYAFYPFLFGIYPYTNATQKQQEAMRLTGIKYPTYTIKELSYSFISRQLQAILQ